MPLPVGMRARRRFRLPCVSMPAPPAMDASISVLRVHGTERPPRAHADRKPPVRHGFQGFPTRPAQRECVRRCRVMQRIRFEPLAKCRSRQRSDRYRPMKRRRRDIRTGAACPARKLPGKVEGWPIASTLDMPACGGDAAGAGLPPPARSSRGDTIRARCTAWCTRPGHRVSDCGAGRLPIHNRLARSMHDHLVLQGNRPTWQTDPDTGRGSPGGSRSSRGRQPLPRPNCR